MAVAWPTVKDRLVALLPALLDPGVLVLDGQQVTGEAPSRMVYVGWQPSTDDLSAGSYEQSTPPDGWSAAESGTVLLEFRAATGDTEMPSAFDDVEALQSAVQADPSLGVLAGAPTISLSVDVVPAQSGAGAVQVLLVSLSYSCLVA